jgi:hypothetical protein
MLDESESSRERERKWKNEHTTKREGKKTTENILRQNERASGFNF